MNLRTATGVAGAIVVTLRPLCGRIEIVGSIRRRCPEVGDIDLVILPKDGDDRAVRQRLRRNCNPVTDGQQSTTLRMPMSGPWPGVQIDVWFARPETSDLFGATPTNWGSLVLCRTGSKEHNIRMVQEAKKKGFRWQPHEGLFDQATGDLIASETEERIFEALEMPFVKPEDRR